MGVDYERELKKLLGGELEAVVKMKKTCSAIECLGYGSMESYPFMVIRGAGSFGVDLVALRGELSFPIEVKSSIHPKVYLSQPRLKEQLEQFTLDCKRANTFPLYAYRYKGFRGDPWRVFTIKVDGLKYFSRILNQKVPELRPTKGGNYVMQWDEGMPLSSFLMEIRSILVEIGSKAS
ncbi:MAG: Holliday junction resolvase [Candidatus Thermoplasmatota archaeon]|nr:Holliday junction resolvase [Candidatus Thermoplasmatota archaeon]